MDGTPSPRCLHTVSKHSDLRGPYRAPRVRSHEAAESSRAGTPVTVALRHASCCRTVTAIPPDDHHTSSHGATHHEPSPRSKLGPRKRPQWHHKSAHDRWLLRRPARDDAPEQWTFGADLRAVLVRRDNAPTAVGCVPHTPAACPTRPGRRRRPPRRRSTSTPVDGIHTTAPPASATARGDPTRQRDGRRAGPFDRSSQCSTPTRLSSAPARRAWR